MSFKRGGDDKGALNYQRKRRVSELLYEDIHEEELSKLRNGRYMCKICQHRPTFDTVNMFQVHRQGKKHQHSIEYHERQKQEVQDLIQKRQQDQELLTEQNQTTKDNSHLPLGCNSNIKAGPHSRKMRLDINNTTTNSVPNTTAAETLPGHQLHQIPPNRGTSQQSGTLQQSAYQDKTLVHRNTTNLTQKPHAVDAINLQIDNDILHYDKRKALNFTEKSRENSDSEQTSVATRHARPFERASSKGFVNKRELDDDKDLKLNNVRQFVRQGGESSSKFYHSRKQQNNPKLVPKQQNNSKLVPNVPLNLERQHTVIEQHTAVSWDRFKQAKGKTFIAPMYQKKVRKETQDGPKTTSSMSRDGTSGLDADISGSSDQTQTVPCKKSAEDKKQRAKDFLNALSSGWKRDWDGAWIRDEEVEFDSDEEPPTVT